MTCERVAVRFIWEQGDVFLLDDVLSMHGRDPFEGPRPILISFGTRGI